MCGEGDQLLHWLFFCTNNLRGLEEMKKAMWSVDDSGTFRFSDADNPNQLSFFKNATQDWLAEHLHKKYVGTASRTLAEIQEHVLIETPCYAYKSALAALEAGGRIRVAGCAKGRKKGAFSDDAMKVEFVKGPAVQQPLWK